MFDSNICPKRTLPSILINISFLYIFYRIIFVKASIEGLAIFIIYSLIASFLFIKNSRNILTLEMILYCVIPPLITLFCEFILHNHPDLNILTVLTNKQILEMYNINYAYLLAFLPLPFILYNLKYRTLNLFKITMLSTITYITLNLYLYFALNLNRDGFNEKFGQIINYDFLTLIIISTSLIYSFYLFETRKKYTAWILFLVSLFAFSLNIMHGTRGAWLAIPIIFLYTMFSYKKTCKPFIRTLIFSCFLLIIALSSFRINGITDRLQNTNQDISLIQNNSSQVTSIGSRLIMWKNSIDIFQSSPLIGVGSLNLAQETCNLNKKGFLDKNSCFTHVHNIYFQELASHGVLGLISLCILFFYPLYRFIKFRSYPDSTTKLVVTTGIVTILTVMICGLTDYFFISQVSMSLYSVIILVLLTHLQRISHTGVFSND
ncbi:O-antigen ligase family protein [Acinetobacter sp. MD2]|uniref:O-antigen ligase family protein n=1 Tax=Acinetobacter sp. MD2 TaxID=2600066 RepID=UPI002D1F8978|nr:O-antigen ligase family protein [Acinetobacter sp. MD2]MEB3768267.1 O-antigen ligase family protein [Acinetobacter sp. MD2]